MNSQKSAGRKGIKTLYQPNTCSVHVCMYNKITFKSCCRDFQPDISKSFPNVENTISQGSKGNTELQSHFSRDLLGQRTKNSKELSPLPVWFYRLDLLHTYTEDTVLFYRKTVWIFLAQNTSRQQHSAPYPGFPWILVLFWDLKLPHFAGRRLHVHRGKEVTNEW